MQNFDQFIAAGRSKGSTIFLAPSNPPAITPEHQVELKAVLGALPNVVVMSDLEHEGSAEFAKLFQ